MVRQLVAFRLNTGGELDEIETADDFTLDPDNEARLSSFSRDVYIDENRYTPNQNYTALAYNYENSESFGKKYLARPTTKIFQLPPEGSSDESYKMIQYTDLPGGSEATALTRVTLYDVDANYHIGAIVWEKLDTTTLPSHPNSRLFVTGTYKGMDAEGNPAYYIEGMNEFGAIIKLSVEDGMTAFFAKAYTDATKDDPKYFEADPQNPETWPSDRRDPLYYANGKNKHTIPATDIKAGDMLNYTCTPDYKATMLSVVARATSPLSYELCYDSYWYKLPTNDYYHGTGHCYVVSCGTVKSRIEESFVTEFTGMDGMTYYRAYPNTGLELLFDTKTGTTRKISMTELQVGDKVLTWHRTSDILFAVAIR